MTSPIVLPLQLRMFALVVLAAFLAWIVYLVRYHRLSLRDTLLWVLSSVTALAFTAHPSALRAVASALGIEIASNALFALTFVYVLLNLLGLTIAHSALASRTRRLAQECALLRAEIDSVRRRVEAEAVRQDG